MFMPKVVFEKLMSVYENSSALLSKQTEDGLNRVLSAKDAEIRAIIAAKDQQIVFLREELDRARDLIVHERERAEAAIDNQLSAIESTPVRHADLQRKLAEREVETAPQRTAMDEKSKVASQIFKELNSTLEDFGSEDPTERLASIGGHPA